MTYVCHRLTTFSHTKSLPCSVNIEHKPIEPMKKVVIATDSFKGSLSSLEAGDALRCGLLSVWKDARVKVVAVADGGEGTAEVLVASCRGEWREVGCSDPLGRRIVARYGLCGTTAVMDVAAAAGYTLLAPEERNPMMASSRGVGELIATALRSGAESVCIGVGGSATCDGGAGLLQGLGYELLDRDGRVIRGCGESLLRIESIRSDGAVAIDGKVKVLADVDNPLCGERGAARVFAPQKGATPEQVEMLERGLRHFAEVVERHFGRPMSEVEGAGAAGGIGGTLYALGATIVRGAEAVVEAVGLEREFQDADLVITGEGRIDSQTTMGKVASEVLRVGRKSGVDVVAVGGSVVRCHEVDECGFAAIYVATPEAMPLREALRKEVATANLQRIGAEIARKWS